MGLETCKIAPTPNSTTAAKDDEEDDQPLDAEEASTFRTVTGILAYFGVGRRDVQYDINKLARQMREPKTSGWTRMKRLLRYLAGTFDAYIWIAKPNETLFDYGTVELKVWTDSDWAGDRKDRRSQSSLLIEADGQPMFGHSRRQAVVAQSSAEAEFYAAASGLSEAMLLREVFLFAGLPWRPP